MLIFLDFDGTMHPVKSKTEPLFCRLDLLEAWLRKWPVIDVVISSSWREQHSFDEMQSYFADDLQARIVGATPVIGVNQRSANEEGTAQSLPTRQTEIERWLKDSDRTDQAWIAFDDDKSLFKDGCPNLIRCDPAIGLTTIELAAAEEHLCLQAVEEWDVLEAPEASNKVVRKSDRHGRAY